VVILAKILIIVSCVGLLRCSEKFRIASQELDDQAITALKNMMHFSEEMGLPRSVAPLFILLSFVCFMLSMYAIEASLLR